MKFRCVHSNQANPLIADADRVAIDNAGKTGKLWGKTFGPGPNRKAGDGKGREYGKDRAKPASARVAPSRQSPRLTATGMKRDNLGHPAEVKRPRLLIGSRGH
jgi:hypothetical protein